MPDVVTANAATNSISVLRQALPPLGFLRLTKSTGYKQFESGPSATGASRFRATIGYSPGGISAASFSFSGTSTPNPQPMTITGSGTSASYTKVFTGPGPPIDTAFNDADFDFSITTPVGMFTRSLSLTGAAFPVDVPTITSTTGFIIGNDLYLDSTIDNVITWNPFSDMNRQTRDRIVLLLQFFTAAFSTDTTSVTIPAYSLPADFYSPLSGELQFIKYRDLIDPTDEMGEAKAGKLRATSFGLFTFPPPSLSITSITRLANGHIQIVGNTVPNHALSIRSSPDMIQPFRTLPVVGTVTSDADGIFVFEDDNPGPRRFYRATMP